MNQVPPMYFNWDAGRSVMVPRRPRMADRIYVDGEEYRLGVIEERSTNSHAHYFAALAEAWQNLSDEQIERWPSVDHLRKYALIKTGYCDERSLACSSKAAAGRIAALVRGMDGYAIVALSECTVRVFTAKSQAYRHMGKDVFQASKTAVLDYVASLIGTTRGQLEQHAGTHA